MISEKALKTQPIRRIIKLWKYREMRIVERMFFIAIAHTVATFCSRNVSRRSHETPEDKRQRSHESKDSVTDSSGLLFEIDVSQTEPGADDKQYRLVIRCLNRTFSNNVVYGARLIRRLTLP